METIDLTPTWAQIIPTWLRLAKVGYSENNSTIIENFENEITRMAKAADNWTMLCKAHPGVAKEISDGELK